MTTTPREPHETYRTDVLYVPHYTHMLSPAFMRFALLLRGYDMPRHDAGGADEPFRYLELGFGMGDSLVIHAASTEGEFWGVDFLPGHCDAARARAAEAGVLDRCRILQNSFEEIVGMAEAGALPLFDVIALHGVWSWIDAANRGHILRILRSRLKRGGVAYVSYNALPGWAVFMPLRDAMLGMMADSARTDPGAGTGARIRTVMERLLALTKSDGAYFRLNPLCEIYFARMAEKPPAFLAHDFCNPTWQPFSFREAAEDFATAGCAFAASADLFHHVDAFLPPETGERVREAETADAAIAAGADPYLGETLRDLALNTQFRADLFLRTPERQEKPERLAGEGFRKKLGSAAISLAVLPEIVRDLPMELTYGLNKMRLDETLCRPLLDALAEKGDAPVRIGDLPGGLPDSEIALRRLVDHLAALREAGYIREG